jgi:integrase/recombinase XerD
MRGGIRGGVRCMPEPEWPQPDRLAWAEALRPADAFDLVQRPAAQWRPRTRQSVENGYGRFLTWLAEQDLLDPEASPDRRVTRDRVRAYRADLARTLADYSVMGRVAQLGQALRVMVPEQDWGWIRRGSERLRAKAVPVRDKLARMRPAHEVLQLGRDLMEKADCDPYLPAVMRAKIYRDGLIIAFLILCPLRRSNLGAIDLDLHLFEVGAGWDVTFGDGETKQKRGMEMSWPEQLEDELARYLEVHRPVLLACTRKNLPPTRRLWISGHGTAMTYGAIALQVKARTKAAFGVEINPHLFRDIVATYIATGTPEQAGDIALALAHSTQRTSERHYNHAGRLRATARLQQVVAAKRKRGEERERKEVDGSAV